LKLVFNKVRSCYDRFKWWKGELKMRTINNDIDQEYIPVELHRMTEEEFELGEPELCEASAD